MVSVKDYYREYQTILKKRKFEVCLAVHDSIEWPMTLIVFLTVDCTWRAGLEIHSDLSDKR